MAAFIYLFFSLEIKYEISVCSFKIVLKNFLKSNLYYLFYLLLNTIIYEHIWKVFLKRAISTSCLFLFKIKISCLDHLSYYSEYKIIKHSFWYNNYALQNLLSKNLIKLLLKYKVVPWSNNFNLGKWANFI